MLSFDEKKDAIAPMREDGSLNGRNRRCLPFISVGSNLTPRTNTHDDGSDSTVRTMIYDDEKRWCRLSDS